MNEEVDHLEDENLLPNLNSYKYQYLNKYTGDEFINAFVLELIIRIVEINDLMDNEMIYENIDFTIENGEFKVGDTIKVQEDSKEKDSFSINFGLSSSYLANLFMMHPYYQEEEKSDLLDFTYNFSSDSIITKEINLDLTEDELIDDILKLKRTYESSLDPLKTLHIDLKNKIKKMLKKMPDTMKIKEQGVIKALFTYDYVQARNKQIDSYNNLDYEEEEDREEDFIKHPQKNTNKDDSYFKEKEFSISGITPGTGKKLYYYLNSILTKYDIKLK